MVKRPKIEPIREPSLFAWEKLEKAADPVCKLEIDCAFQEAGLLLGTSAFTAAGWPGTFYPEGMRSSNYLKYYATKFKTVEIDSSYYGTPSVSTVTGWYEKTPRDFIFAAKVPQIITHEKVLVDCDAELEQFLDTMSILGEKRGPIVFQFPFFDRWKFPKQADFLAVLGPFLKKLPPDAKFAIEIRNKAWLDTVFADLLREHRVALVLQDLSYMPGPAELAKKFDPITADWTYVRWLGDRKGIEAQTTVWDNTIVDRTRELQEWVEIFRRFVARNIKIFAYANNHYAGHAPATIKVFWDLWNKK
jgi:uncharacterized protein YecE (DUF72 family)